MPWKGKHNTVLAWKGTFQHLNGHSCRSISPSQLWGCSLSNLSKCTFSYHLFDGDVFSFNFPGSSCWMQWSIFINLQIRWCLCSCFARELCNFSQLHVMSWTWNFTLSIVPAFILETSVLLIDIIPCKYFRKIIANHRGFNSFFDKMN